MDAGKNYDKEMMNVIENIIGTRLRQVYEATDGLVECEVKRVEKIIEKNLDLLAIGLSVIALSFTVVSLFLCLSDKYLNHLWIDLFRRCKAHVFIIKSAIEDRLRYIHNLEEFAVTESKIVTEKLTESSLRKRHSIQFLFKLSIIFFLSAVFIILTTQYFYKGIQSTLEYRPLLLSSIGRRRSKMTGLAFSVLESYSESANYSIYTKYSNFSDIINSSQIINMKINEIINTGNFISNHKANSLMSKSLYDKIFKFFPGSIPCFAAGADRATDFLVQESYFLESNSINSGFQEISSFMDEIHEFNNVYLVIAEQAAYDSKMKIEEKIYFMIVFVVIFAVLLLGIFILLYYPMLRYETKVVKWLIDALNLIPRKI